MISSRQLALRTAMAALVGGAAGVFAANASAQVAVDPELPRYEPTSGISGSIKSVGSDTLNNLLTYWIEEFARFYPNVTIETEGKGSSTAPPALIEGTAQLGPMSRQMRGSEIDAFVNRYGYEPTLLRVGIDALAVYVHKDNPLESMTLDQVRQVFSVEGRDMTWGDLGVEDPQYRNRPITLYGRNSASGTYGFFKDVALGGADFKASVNEQPGSSTVVQAVASDRFAMGYSGIGYATADVRAVPLSDWGEPVIASEQTAYSGEYPLVRFLYVYVNIAPNRPPTPVVREFIRMIYSREGQEQVVKDGYFPVTPFLAEEDLATCNIEP